MGMVLDFGSVAGAVSSRFLSENEDDLLPTTPWYKHRIQIIFQILCSVICCSFAYDTLYESCIKISSLQFSCFLFSLIDADRGQA